MLCLNIYKALFHPKIQLKLFGNFLALSLGKPTRNSDKESGKEEGKEKKSIKRKTEYKIRENIGYQLYR